MALIGKIRNNFWFVLILLGFALVAFIFMDIQGNQSVSASSGPSMGSVEGTDINYNDFRRTESSLYRNSGGDTYAIQNSLWNYYVEDAIINKEAEANGIGVSKEELRNLQFGNNPSKIIQQNFRDPQTGQINRAQLNEIKTAIDNDEFTNLEFRTYWVEQEKQIIKDQKQTKLNAMVSKAMFTPTWMVEQMNKENTTTANFTYVKIPFDQIGDGDVTVTDDAIASYVKKNAVTYTNEQETRRASYAVFDVVATAKDTAECRKQIYVKIDGFRNTKSDSIYSINNNGNYVNYFAGLDELPEYMQSIVAALDVKEVSAPFIDNGYYVAAKLVDKKVVPDSVRARHILRNVEPGNLTQLEAARTLIDSIKGAIESRSTTFDAIARTKSQDPGSGAKGGDLGYFTQGSMVPAFNKACFFEPKGGLKVVETKIGVHLIDVRDQKYLNRDPKYKTAIIRYPITPSQNTQDSIYNIVSEMISGNRDMTKLTAAVEGMGGNMELATFVDRNTYTMGTLGSGTSSRNMVKWLFDSDTDLNEVSPEVYAYSNEALYYNEKYVVQGLQDISAEGLLSVPAARDRVESIVRNQLKGEKIASQISGSDLDAIASQFGVEKATTVAASINTTNITGIGNEPKVLLAALNNATNSVVGPIVGNSGVYMVLPSEINEGNTAANIPLLRSTANNAARSSVTFGLINALKKASDVEDNRFSLDF